MKIIIATDSYKGSSSAIEVAKHIEKGIKRVDEKVEVVKIPIADGGEGTVEALVYAAGGEIRNTVVVGPIGKKVMAHYGIISDSTAVIEMAAASGLPLLMENEKNPFKTTTFGTGELIKRVIDEGYRNIIIGIGGSATNDGGLGMAQALGISFKDKEGEELGFGGGELSKLDKIEFDNFDKRVLDCNIVVACDVTNPLCGEKGASAVYGPQKGATPEMVKALDKNLSHYADVIEKQMGQSVREVPGAGAAGGLGAGLITFCKAQLKSGVDTILDAVKFERQMKEADLIITGEGRIDGQSIYGKVPVGVARRVKAQRNIPVVALVGGIGAGANTVYDYGIDAMMSIVDGPMSLEEAMEKTSELIESATERMMRMIEMSVKID